MQIVARGADKLQRVLVHGKANAPLGQTLFHAAHHQPGDLVDFRLLQGVEYDDLIHAVQKFRTEGALDLLHDVFPHGIIRLFRVLGAAKAQGALPLQFVRTGVTGHDDDGIFEVHHPALTVGKPPVLQNLQKDVEYVRMGLFHLVQQNHGVGLAAHLFGKLAALLVAHIARRRADESGNGVFFHIFGHVDANQTVLVPEQRLAQGLAQFGFAHARGAQEDEGADGPVGILQPCPGPAHGPGNGLHRFLLAHHPGVQNLFQVHQPGGLVLGHAGNGNTRPGGDDLRHLVLAHDFDLRVAPLFPVSAAFGHFVVQLLLFVPQPGGLFEVLVGDGLFGFLVQGLQLRLLLLHVRRRGKGLNAHPGSGLVDKVDGLVRQKAIGNIPVGQVHRGANSVVGNLHPVMGFVTIPQAHEDFHGFLPGGFPHVHRLEPALQGGVLFNVLMVFVQGGRAHALNFAPGQHGLEDIGRVNGPFGSARAYDGVQFVDKENHVPRLADFAHGVFQPLLEFAPVFGPRQHAGQIQRNHPLVPKYFGNVSLDNQLGQTFHNGAFAHAGLADEHGVILGAPRKNLHNALDFPAAADDGIQFPRPGRLGQIPGELIQRRGLVFPGSALRRRGGFLAAADHSQKRFPGLVQIQPHLDQHMGRHALPLPHQRQQQVFYAHVFLL